MSLVLIVDYVRSIICPDVDKFLELDFINKVEALLSIFETIEV